MPRVPTYEGLQVGAGSLPQTRLSSPDAPDAGRALQEVGQGLSRAGSQVSKIALEKAQQAAQVVLNDRMNQAIAARLHLTHSADEGYLHLKGEAAIKGPEGKSREQEYLEKYDKSLADIEATLGNALQRQMFRERANTLRQQFHSGLSAHALREHENFQASVQDGTVKLGLEQMASSWGDEAAVQQASDAIKAAVVERGQQQGLAAVETEAELLAVMTRGHTSVIASAIDAGQLDYAQQHLAAHGDEISAAAKAQIGERLPARQQDARAQAAVDTLMDSGLPLAEMRQRLREQFGKDAEMRRRADDLLDKEYRRDKHARAEHEAGVLDEVYKLLDGNGGDLATIPASLWMQIPGDKRDDVRGYAKRVRPDGGGRVNDTLAWAQVMNLSQEALRGMTTVEFHNRYRHLLDDAHLEKGYALIKAAQGQAEDKHREIIPVPERVKRAAIGAGIIPSDGKATPEQLAALADFERSVDEEVREFERRNLQGKRPASSEEMQAILDRYVMNRVNVSGWVWDDKDVAVVTLTDKQAADAYVTVDGQKVKLVEIPASQRAQITDALSSRSIPVTEQAIAQMWVRAGKPKD